MLIPISSDPLEVVQEGYARYARRDFAGVFELLSPDIEINQTTELPWGGRFVGHAGARQFFAMLGQHTTAMPRPTDYITAGEDIVAIGRLEGVIKATETTIDLKIVHVWKVQSGKIVRFDAFVDTPAMKTALQRTAK